ncbi:hypothetical protein EV424DRAFT_1539788 [Suillus variegatus]|nr:hypothetical protein EV424DRAFT_1539788 [Suillus variegatus]
MTSEFSRTEEVKDAKFKKRLCKLMKRNVEQALADKQTFSSFMFSKVVKERAHQHRTPSHWNNSKEPLQEWHDPNNLKPRIAVSQDGVPLVLHLPNAIHSRGKKSLFHLLRLFGQNAKLTRGQGADSKKRDKKDSYKLVCGQLAGNIKLVSMWHAVGQTHKPPIISGT